VLTKQIVRFLEDGEDFSPLVFFFDNVQQNPNEHSQEQLYEWLDRRDFTITDDGMIVGYKSVDSAGDDEFLSISQGKAIVNGQVQQGRIRQAIGDVVEMPRSEVEWDPSVGCHRGLHVGTWDYAKNFSGDTMLEIHVNPRDVVSVPTDCDAAKVRCCRYTVVDVLDKPYSSALRRTTYYEPVSTAWGEAEECWSCGGYVDQNGECDCD
jgi:hypothetical protein